jgi:hypothetical protein
MLTAQISSFQLAEVLSITGNVTRRAVKALKLSSKIHGMETNCSMENRMVIMESDEAMPLVNSLCQAALDTAVT